MEPYQIIKNESIFQGVEDKAAFDKKLNIIKNYYYQKIISHNVKADGSLKKPSDIYDASDYYILYNQEIKIKIENYILNLIKAATKKQNNLKTISFLMDHYIDESPYFKYADFISEAEENGNFEIIRYFIIKKAILTQMIYGINF